MKPPKSEMRELLNSDEDKVLRDTWYEYSDDQPLPTEDRPLLIEAILDLMERDGDVIPDQEADHFTLPDLARKLGVNPKVAREKFRKASKKGKVPESLKSTGWVFDIKHKSAITEIIRLRRSK